MTTLACRVPQKSLIKKFIIQRNERKNMYKYREELAGEKWFTIPEYNTSASNIPYMTTLAYRLPQKSLIKIFIIQMSSYGKYGSMQRKKSNTEKNKQEKAVGNATIQPIIINLHTKYDYSSLHDFSEIFDEKFHYSKYKNENWTIQGRISRRRLVCNSTIQRVLLI